MSRKKPVVAAACSSPSWGGMEMQAVIAAEELARRDYTVLFLAARGTPIEKEAASRGLAVYPILSGNYFAPVAVVRSARLFRDRAVRLVHTEYSRDLWTLVPAARLAGAVPLVLTKRLASSVNKTDPLHRRLYAGTARVIAISSMIEENLLKRTPVPKEKIVRIPNGVDLALFPSPGKDRAAARADLAIPWDATAIGLVGRISRGKGQIDFVRAAALTAAETPEARFFLIGSVTKGEEEYARRLEETARGSGLGDRLRFTGFRDDIPRLLSALDVLAVPSRSEALGNVVLEGMAASLPIAAVGRAGIRDMVTDGVNGILFPPDDPESMAAAFVRLARDEELRTTLGKAGRRRVEETYTREKRTDRIEELYADLIKERGDDRHAQ